MVRLEPEAFAAIVAHAREAYPEECCGAVLEEDGHDRPRRITNVQSRLHAEDPGAHPRDARTAYHMDPQELLAVLRDSEQPGRYLKAFYHSHPDHDAYFSREDRRRGLFDGEPAYPGTAYVVVSVRGGELAGARAYAWDAGVRDFVEVPLVVT